MGYAYYVLADGREAGYSVDALCDQAECFEHIDRGLAHLCGEQPDSEGPGCKRYFCTAHLFIYGGRYGHIEDDLPDLCVTCMDVEIEKRWREPLRQQVEAAGFHRDRLRFDHVDDLTFRVGLEGELGSEWMIQSLSDWSPNSWIVIQDVVRDQIRALRDDQEDSPLAHELTARVEQFNYVGAALEHVLAKVSD